MEYITGGKKLASDALSVLSTYCNEETTNKSTYTMEKCLNCTTPKTSYNKSSI